MMIEKILESLKKNRRDEINYVIPDMWFLDELNIEYKRLPSKEILLNPYDYFISLIETYILPNKKNNIDYTKSLSKALNIKSSNGSWIEKSIIYSSMIRTQTTYDNDRSFSIDLKNINKLKETGTFLKTLSILPLLKRLGVNVLYLLPITKYSTKDKKGELGSPYAVESFFELDPILKDDLTLNDLTINEEFKALVEACHIMGIRVTIDIIPRTSSITSDLIVKHPDWFYWIKSSEFLNYKAPYIETLGNTVYPSYENMKKVYESNNTFIHIKKFSDDPKTLNPSLYNEIKDLDTIDFLNEVEKRLNIKIAPAFSDNINDIQPPWSDITYLRMYLDDTVFSKDYINFKHSPYILFDTAKANLYNGEKENSELWELLSSIIPYFIKNYGIDGARIDMGHALPLKLLNLIINRAKDVDDDFSFIAEELNMSNDKACKDAKYNAMIGNSFYSLSRTIEGEAKRFIYNTKNQAIMPFAAPETHDTKRAVMRYGNRIYSRFIFILSYFIPYSIPFINSGIEFYEKEPMNIGLDSSSDDLYSLDSSDIFYTKLALFDKYQLHYTNEYNNELIDHLKDPLKIRMEWVNEIIDKDNVIILDSNNDNRFIINYCFKKNNKYLLIVGNFNMDNSYDINIDLNVLGNINNTVRELYSTYEFPTIFKIDNNNLNLYIKNGELKIIEIDRI